ncbi:MAG: ABC transporter permease [Candidatus Dormibacteria bacterium]
MSIGATTLATIAAGQAPPPTERRSRALRLPRSPKVIVGLGILLVFVVIAIVGPMIAPYDPNAQVLSWIHIVCQQGPYQCIGQVDPVTHLVGTNVPLEVPLGPSPSHWLGTTLLGGDVWSQLLASTRPTLVVAFLAGLAATALSVLIGVSAGYLGGSADEGLSLFSNVFLAIPGLPLLIVLASYVPGADTSVIVIGLIVALTGWAYGSRVLRAQTLSLRNRDFVEAARVSGEGRLRIILAEVMPNLLPIIASSFLFTTLYAIGAYISLAFLGLAGVPTSSPPGPWNWGIMLQQVFDNNAVNTGYWWWWLPPGICIALVGTALALLNFGIDEFINPRLRASGLSRKAARRAGISFRSRLGFTPVVSDRSAPIPRAAALAGTEDGSGGGRR